LLLSIEKLVYGGDGLARLPEEAGRRKAVFTPFVLAGETVEAEISENSAGFARARLQSVTESSPHRITPPCPYFGTCGGCHYQHSNYEHQLEIKAEILRENLRRLTKLELAGEIRTHESPPWNYRNRSRLAVRNEGSFVLGYRRMGMEEVLAVEDCPISSPLIQRAIKAFWKLGRGGVVPSLLREVEFFADAEDTGLQVTLHTQPLSKSCEKELTQFTEILTAKFPEALSVAALAEPERKRAAASATPPKPRILSGPGALVWPIGPHKYRVSVGSFFQSNRHLLGPLVDLVTSGKQGGTALDLYAGVGLFTLPLASHFGKVIAVESSPASHADLRYNSPTNVEAIRAATETYLDEAAGKLRADLVVVDPPRTGLGNRVTRSLTRLGASRITYVSCDPATLARDLVPLLAAGYRVAQAHVVDLFPQTYHLESVIELAR
jgi:23S rRNA (uracil1939-C5)-methyltransferase